MSNELQHWEANREVITHVLNDRISKNRTPALEAALWYTLGPLFARVENPEDYLPEAVRDAAHDLSLLAGI